MRNIKNKSQSTKSPKNKKFLTFQEIIFTLNNFWSKHGCVIGQPYGLEVGAGTSNPLTALRVLGPEPFNVAYVEPSRRPADGRYGENPNRLQHYFQYQVILKPAPRFNTYMFIEMLQELGFNPEEHDIRFVEDNWESPSLGAWGLGWEVWLNGMEVTQYTYFQQMSGIDLDVPALEITIGLERLAMYIQNVDNYADLQWNNDLTYGDIFKRHEFWQSTYNYQTSNVDDLNKLYKIYQRNIEEQISHGNYWAAYDFLLKLSHTFNLLDAKGVISVTDRVNRFKEMGKFANAIAKLRLEDRKQLNYPLLNKSKVTYEIPKVKAREILNESNNNHQDTLVLELGFEEIPPQYIKQLRNTFNNDWLNQKLQEFGYTEKDYSNAHICFTPQRISIIIRNIKDNISKELIVNGPPVQIAYENGDNNKPSKALKSFLAKQQANLSDIKIKDSKVFIHKIQNLDLTTLASNIVTDILSIDLKTKYMRWNQHDYKFIRPLRWILAMHNEKILGIHKFGINSNNFTLTPRYKKPVSILLSNASEYLTLIKQLGIILDAQERKNMIIQPLHDYELNTELINENTFLTEHPTVKIMNLPDKYYSLPEELIFKILEHHQRYLVFKDKNKIQFAIVINNVNTDAIHNIAELNKKVVTARLDDGLFYFTNDLKKDLKSYRTKLQQITFHPQVGTYFDKVNAIQDLYTVFKEKAHQKVDIPKEIFEVLYNDKATETGTEFPELEGYIGAAIAKQQNYPKKIVTILQDYVKSYPETTEGTVLSILSTIYDIVVLSGIGGLPKGNNDPYQIRQKVFKLIKLSQQININLMPLIAKAWDFSSQQSQVTLKEISEYITKRIENLIKNSVDLPSEYIRGIAFALNRKNNMSSLNIFEKLNFAKQFSKLSAEEQTKVFDTTKRVTNILNKAKYNCRDINIRTGLLKTAEEQSLYNALIKHRDSHHIPLHVLITIADLLEKFFNTTLVMDNKEEIQKNRLQLLCLANNIVSRRFKYSS